VTAQPSDPERLLDRLDPEQQEAVRITRGPLVIHAGAGSGKTRVISHRVAYAVATGAVDPRQVLVVTFTDKAAGEMVERLAGLGLRGVVARTFHAAALSQLAYFWPLRHAGEPAPKVLESKVPILMRLARDLPGGYRFTPTKDLADEIEWAKSRRLSPRTYADAAAAQGREPPVPADLFVGLWRGYERAKDRAGRIDFDDMLTRTVELLETDDDAATTVRRRYAWFSVDEYQDTNPLQQRLLELWRGPRDDLCVVGDEDQTIYTFTGATPEYLVNFSRRYPTARQVTLSRNYRSSPEVLALANRLLAADGRSKRLVATQPTGPAAEIRRCADAAAELTLVTARIRALVDAGTRTNEIAILVRMNAQIPPIEDALRMAGIPFQVRGQGFYERREVREAIRLVRALPAGGRGDELVRSLEARLEATLGYRQGAGERTGAVGAEARERDSALATFVDLVRQALEADGDATPAMVAASLDRAAAEERTASPNGVNLLTLHRAKGLEWDAVFLPGVEEGTLPIRQADTPHAVTEERRLLYVGITRARRHLLITWAEMRAGPNDRESRRRPSRFLRDIEAGPRFAGSSTGRSSASGASRTRERRVTDLGGPSVASNTAGRTPDQQRLMEALKAWRTERARTDGVPAYVIAHDSLLDALVDRRPDSVAALRRVPGMGPVKIERYGEELLRILRPLA
jgi:DNA helicase-2/ATP-dependent DNA helicase PcrA